MNVIFITASVFAAAFKHLVLLFHFDSQILVILAINTVCWICANIEFQFQKWRQGVRKYFDILILIWIWILGSPVAGGGGGGGGW